MCWKTALASILNNFSCCQDTEKKDKHSTQEWNIYPQEGRAYIKVYKDNDVCVCVSKLVCQLLGEWKDV